MRTVLIVVLSAFVGFASRADPVPHDYVRDGVRTPGGVPPDRLAPGFSPATSFDFLRGGLSAPGTIVSAAPSRPPAFAGPGGAPRSVPAAVAAPGPTSAGPPPNPVPSPRAGGVLPPLPPDCVARGVDTILTPACMRFLTSEPPRLARLGGGSAVLDPVPPSGVADPMPPVPPPAALPSPSAMLQCSVSGPRGREDAVAVLNPESCLRLASVSMVTKGSYSVMLRGVDGNVVVVGCLVAEDGGRPGCDVRP